MSYGISLTYRRFSSRETGRANPKIILSVASASSLFVYCRVGYRVGQRNERQVRENSFYFVFSCGHRSRRSVSILPSIEFNGVAHILLLSFVLPSSLLALLSHTMVIYPSFRQPDQPLIPTSPSLNSQRPRNQRSARISSPSSVASPVHRTSLPFTPSRPAADLVSFPFFYSIKDAKRYLEKHKRIENAIDAYYNEGGGSSSSRTTPSGLDPATATQRLEQMYNTYKGVFSSLHPSKSL